MVATLLDESYSCRRHKKLSFDVSFSPCPGTPECGNAEEHGKQKMRPVNEHCNGWRKMDVGQVLDYTDVAGTNDQA